MNYQDPFGFSHKDSSEQVTNTVDQKNLSMKGMGWISFLRVVAWIQFAGIIIIGFVVGASIDDESLVGIFVCGFIAVLIAFSSIALIMVLLDAAENLMHIRKNTEHIKQ